MRPGLCENRDTNSDPYDNQFDRLDAAPKMSVNVSRELAYCFLRVANIDNGAFDRLRRYEAALWRQTLQALFALRATRHR